MLLRKRLVQNKGHEKDHAQRKYWHIFKNTQPACGLLEDEILKNAVKIISNII